MQKIGQEYDTFVHFSEPVGGKEIFLEIYGYTYEELSKLAMQMASLMSKVKDFSDIKVRYRPGRPEVKVMIDSNRVSMFGLTNQEIGEGLHAQLRGLRATTFYDKNEEIETVVRLNPEQCKTIKQLKTLVFLSPYDFFVPVDHIANLVFDLSPS
jgi:Cu/Ag efflux pump CusA